MLGKLKFMKSSHNKLIIKDNFFKNGGTTYLKGINYNTEEDYELTGGLKEFEVEEIEVYEVSRE